MKTKDEVEHALEDEADHLAHKQEKRAGEQDLWETPTAANSDAQLSDTLEAEIASYWDDPNLRKLLEDSNFNTQFDRTCENLFNRFQPRLPADYTCDDYKQELIAQFAKTLSKFRGESELETWLYRIALNWLINITRQKRCDSFESLFPPREDGEERESIAVWDRCQTNRNSTEEDEHRKILAHQLLNKLSPREQFILYAYKVEKKTTEEIGDELDPKVTRQAVSKQLKRIYKKLESFIEQPIRSGDSPVKGEVKQGSQSRSQAATRTHP